MRSWSTREGCLWQPLPRSSGAVPCVCGPLSQATSRAAAVSELTPCPMEENGLFLALCRGPPHVSWGLPQPLAAPGARAGWVRLSLEWAVGSGSWREGGCYTDLAASLSPPLHTHLPGGKIKAQVEVGGVAQAVVAGGPQRHTDTASAHVLGKLTGQLTPFLWFPPMRPGAPSCPRFLSDK